MKAWLKLIIQLSKEGEKWSDMGGDKEIDIWLQLLVTIIGVGEEWTFMISPSLVWEMEKLIGHLLVTLIKKQGVVGREVWKKM